MLSVAQAHDQLISLFRPVGTERIALADARDRVLAEDVVAARNQPPFAASAMDGYAVRHADIQHGRTLKVIDAAVAGKRSNQVLAAGEAIRIFTGAPVPQGADCVVIQEDVTRTDDRITINIAAQEQDHIRALGCDFREGARLEAPRKLSPGDVALIAAMNVPEITVFRRPEIALIATGDELVMPGGSPSPDQIVSSNNFGLKVALEAAGARIRLLPIARDTLDSLSAVFNLAQGADAIVTLGGASVGDFDLVQDAALGKGMELEFYKVAMRPGKPLMAGKLGRTPIIGLPGNPVSAMVCGHLFLRPAIDVMRGLPGEMDKTASAILTCDLEPNGPRQHYMRAIVEMRDGQLPICTPLARQDSSLLSVLSRSNCLLVRPPHDSARKSGEIVEFLRLD